MENLTNDEIARYQAHLNLDEVGMLGQEKIKNSSILVIGCGGFGCPALTYLAAAGIGTLAFLDDDRVSLSNLHRQILFSDSDIGKFKVDIAKEKLEKINPHVKLLPLNLRLTANNSKDLISQYDLIIDCSDNFKTKYIINDTCIELAKPFIGASVFKFHAQLSLYNYQQGPSYRCIFPEPPDVSDVPACSEAGILGVHAGLVGVLQASEALKVILEQGENLSGKLLIINGLTHDFQKVEFKRNEGIIRETKLLSEKEYDQLLNTNCSMIKEILPKELKAKIDNKEDFYLLDVREDFEKQLADIGGELIPLMQLPKEYEKLPKDKTIVVYCKLGGRSHQAVEFLSQFDFKELINLKGGIFQYSDDVDNTISKY